MIRKQNLLIVLFLILYLPFFLMLLSEARAYDLRYGGTVPTIGDELDYQPLAVNLLYGVGYKQDLVLPLELYNLDLTTPRGQQLARQYQLKGIVKVEPVMHFYRGPGFPAFLSVVYSLFGNTTLVGRLMTAILIVAVAVLILLTGSNWAGWRGTLAGGIAGLLYLLPQVLRTWDVDRLLTEVPSTFWVTLFGFLFVLHQKTQRTSYFLLATLALLCALFTRSNLMTLLPLLLVVFVLQRYPLRLIVAFVIILAVPLGLWSLYATAQLGKFVTLTTQGEIAFPQYNNPDVLYGIDADHTFQGDWNPGWYYNEAGELTTDYLYAPQPGENGWVKGFRFWLENPLQVPALFFVKLRAGFWTKEGIAGLYTLGLCFLFISLGFCKPGERKHVLPNLSNRQILALQIGLALAATIIMAVLHTSLYLLVLGIYAVMIVLALLRPYGDVFMLPYPSPVWFLTFVASHFITTILFMGVRFHEPLDPLLCMFGAFGLILLIEYILSGARRRRASYVLQPG
jgi:hypothetical protein